MKKLLLASLLMLGGLLSSLNIQASHVSGGDFVFECVGQDSFLITLNLFRDCAGIGAPASASVTFTNSCGGTVTQVLQLDNIGGTEVSQLCVTSLQNSSCNGGFLPGMQIYTYSAIVAFPPACGGVVSATANGGAGNYSFTWPQNRTGSSQDNLCAGNYIVTVEDANGCEVFDTISLTDASNLTLSATVDSTISCFNICDGGISITAAGGTAPYSYHWSSGDSGTTATGLCAGEYVITVMDDNGNQYRHAVTLANPSAVNPVFSIINEGCAGSNDGSIYADVNGGVPPYSYAWSGGLSGSNPINVTPGTYTLTVTDANGCTGSGSATVAPGTTTNLSLTTTTFISCNNLCIGEITATVAGGVAPYFYSWSNGGTGNIQNALCAGTYTVTVTDANGCSDVQSMTLTQPTAIISNPTITNTPCGAACAGSIALNPIGGAAPYSYAWGITPSPGNVSSVTGLCPGAFTVTITDNNGCTLEETHVISNTGGITSLAFTPTQPSCSGGINGALTVTPSGGTAPYSYTWSTSATTNTISNLSAGDYTVTVTDDVGCQRVQVYSLTDPAPVQINPVITDESCFNSCDGSVVISPSGGAAPYTITWSNAASGNTNASLCAGMYYVTVADNNGCSVNDSFLVDQPTAIAASLNLVDPVSCNGVCDASAAVSVSGGAGNYTYAWSTGAIDTIAYALCSGTHSVTVTDGNGCADTASITIANPALMTATASSSTGPGCSGTWTYNWSTCCRNTGQISNLTSGNIYISGTLNAALEADECNDGPAFEDNPTAYPLQYVCINQQVQYNFGVTNPGNDSLVFSLIPAPTTATQTANYVAPYSGTQPIVGITLDSLTGQVSFTPTALGNFVVVVQVDEYDPVSGLFLSTQYRDIQFVVQNCSNNAPYGNGIDSITTNAGSPILLDSNSVQICEGDDFCMEITFYDSNLTDSNFTINSNVRDILVGPGANDTATITLTVADTVTYNMVDHLRIVATVCWEAPASSAGFYSFTLTADDQVCPTPAVSTYGFDVTVVGSTTASADDVICGDQQAQLTVSGGNEFGWTVLSGDPMQIGVNFSCDSCDNPIATPTITTTYLVTSDLASTCNNTDTVTIERVPDFTAFAGPDTTICVVDSIPLFAFGDSAYNYSYDWNYASTMNFDTLANPLAAPTTTTTYSVTVSSDLGCEKTASATVTLTPPFPFLNPTADDTSLCDGDSANIELILGNTPPTSCGPSTQTCLGQEIEGVIGTGTAFNTATQYPAPFGTDFRSSRHQILYLASELQAQGFSAGLITGLAFDVANFNGANGSMNNFEVKIGCSSLGSMPLTFQTGLTSVYGPLNYTAISGWNMFNFNNPYDWDGTSNIIVEVCFTNPGFFGTSNVGTRFTNTGFNSVTYNRATSGVCTNPNAFTVSANRPNLKLKFCDQPDPNAYTVLWQPNATLSDSTSLTPVATPEQTTTYTVFVNDTFGVCSDTGDITIYKGFVDAGPDTTICAGDTITMSAVSDTLANTTCPGGSITYSWAPTTGLSNPNILNPTVTSSVTREYFLTYSTSCGCSLVDSVTINVAPMTPPAAQLTDPTCGLSDGEIYIPNPGGNHPLTYSIDSGATFVTDSIFTGLPLGFYYLQVMDSAGCVTEVVPDTLVNPGAPVIDSIVTANVSCFQAQDGLIDIFSSGGTAPITYSIDSVTFFPFSTFNGLPAGDYVVVVEDDSSCQTLPVDINITSNSQILIDSVYFSNLDCFEDYTGDIQIFGSGGTAPLTYSIDSGATYQASPAFDSLLAGDYFLTIRDDNGCEITPQYQVISQPASFNLLLTTTDDTCFQACGGQAVAQLTGGVTPYTYNWNGYGGNVPTSNNLCAGNNYLFSATDSNGCQVDTGYAIIEPSQLVIDSINTRDLTCNGSDDGLVRIYVSGGTAPYSYSLDGGLTTQPTREFNSLSIGTFNILVTDANGCQVTGQVVITEPTLVEVTATISQTTICVSNCVNISAPATGGNGGPYNYYWNQGLDSNEVQNVCPSENTTYSVYAEDVMGCASNVELITVNLHDSLRVDAGPDIEICPEEEVTLGAAATGGDGNGFRYSWSPLAAVSDPFSANPTTQPTATTTYEIRVTDNCGSPAAIDSVTVIVNPLPTVDFYGEDTLAGCEPFDVNLISTSSPQQFARWTIGDDISASGFVADISDLPDGVYDVKLEVTTPAGCRDVLTKQNYLTVYPIPDANFEASPQPTTVFDTRISFNDLSTGNVVDWTWDFAGLNVSKDRNPNYQFPADTGEYGVNLNVSTVRGCEHDTTIIVRIGAEYNLYIPNSFTPNGDGLNDVFSPVGLGVDPDAYSIYIYNRWGELIYEAKTLNRAWDGRIMNSDQMAAIGSYVWKVVANDYTNDSERNEYTGYINVIR